nr:MAG TPA_asm: hypothetical protein [Microviridae sp.]
MPAKILQNHRFLTLCFTGMAEKKTDPKHLSRSPRL